MKTKTLSLFAALALCAALLLAGCGRSSAPASSVAASSSQTAVLEKAETSSSPAASAGPSSSSQSSAPATSAAASSGPYADYESIDGEMEDMAMNQLYLRAEDGTLYTMVVIDADLTGITSDKPGGPVRVYYEGELDPDDPNAYEVIAVVSL